MDTRTLYSIVIILAMSAFGTNDLMAQLPLAPDQQSSIVHKLATEYDERGSVVIEQSDWIMMALYPSADRKPVGEMRGYRVQIFSTNDPMRGKRDAEEIYAEMATYSDAVSSYLIYNAPFWRVRVGNYRTMRKAEIMLYKLRKLLPEQSRNMYIVPDNVMIDPEKPELLD